MLALSHTLHCITCANNVEALKVLLLCVYIQFEVTCTLNDPSDHEQVKNLKTSSCSSLSSY